MPDSLPRLNDQQVIALRPQRNTLDSRRPYAWLVEQEHSAQGQVVDVATVFLTNRECPLRCVMCDLWKNTLTHSVAVGDIPEQIRFGLQQLPAAQQLKLYNSGNFFDRKAIPPADYPAIAELVRGFETVIVENHPRFCDAETCRRFRDLIAPAQLEIAIGLETCHPEVLAALNKRMTLQDFDRAVSMLTGCDIRVRTFLLLQPPFLPSAEAVDWTLRSLDYAFQRGVNCCAVIPTRAGNGQMDQLQQTGHFTSPDGSALEQVLDIALPRSQGRVFVDLWDARRFFACDHCRDARLQRLQQMNLQQVVLPQVMCSECGG